MRNSVEFKVYGKYALFTDPITKIGGEKYSYQIPTYEALKGILSSVYWKPTFIWYIDKMRVMKRIRMQPRGVKPVRYQNGGSDISIYTYLVGGDREDGNNADAYLEYQVLAHFDWNFHREDLAGDRDENKHHNIAKRMIKCGGRRDVFLGARECQGYVEPCNFGEGESEYDNSNTIYFDLMFHGFNYPDETGNDQIQARFWRPKMENGIVKFPHPKECDPKLIRNVKTYSARRPKSIGLKEPRLLEPCEEI
jgi:CRISPR-associated protein Cas5d